MFKYDKFVIGSQLYQLLSGLLLCKCETSAPRYISVHVQIAQIQVHTVGC